MTAIAYRDGIMAADGASWSNNVAVTMVRRKITRLNDGGMVGCAGDTGDITRFLQWAQGYRTDPPPNMGHDFGALLVGADGSLTEFDGDHGPSDASDWPFAAAGIVTEFLYGAMAAGATAEEAVRLAVEKCAYVGGDVQVMHLRETVPLRAVE